MKNYLGEVDITNKVTKYTLYSKKQWVMLWIEMYSGIDGSHHKKWLIDQIVRILKGAPVIIKLAKWDDGTKEERFSLGEPPSEYWQWVTEMKDGAETCGYDFGIAP